MSSSSLLKGCWRHARTHTGRRGPDAIAFINKALYTTIYCIIKSRRMFRKEKVIVRDCVRRLFTIRAYKCKSHLQINREVTVWISFVFRRKSRILNRYDTSYTTFAQCALFTTYAVNAFVVNFHFVHVLAMQVSAINITKRFHEFVRENDWIFMRERAVGLYCEFQH